MFWIKDGKIVLAGSGYCIGDGCCDCEHPTHDPPSPWDCVGGLGEWVWSSIICDWYCIPPPPPPPHPCIHCDEGACTSCDQGSCTHCDQGVCDACDEGVCTSCDQGRCINGDHGRCTSCDQGPCTYCDQNGCTTSDCSTCDEPCSDCPDCHGCDTCDDHCTDCDEGPCGPIPPASDCHSGWGVWVCNPETGSWECTCPNPYPNPCPSGPDQQCDPCACDNGLGVWTWNTSSCTWECVPAGPGPIPCIDISSSGGGPYSTSMSITVPCCNTLNIRMEVPSPGYGRLIIDNVTVWTGSGIHDQNFADWYNVAHTVRIDFNYTMHPNCPGCPWSYYISCYTCK